MADIYIPGVKSRFDTDKIVEGLMAVERLPKTRVEENVTLLEAQKGYWQELSRRISSMRDSATRLFSFQNPFNERTAVSDNPEALTASATREADNSNYQFSVKQTAAADRFMSLPLQFSYKVPAGRYTFTEGESKVSFDYRGGTPEDFVGTLNQKGAGLVRARVINVEKNAKALLIEGLKTGAAEQLGFADDAFSLALDTGLLVKGEREAAAIAASKPLANTQAAQPKPAPAAVPAAPTEPVTIYIKPVAARSGGLIDELTQSASSTASPMSALEIPLNGGIEVSPLMMLKFETEVTEPLTGRHVINSLMLSEEEAAAQNTADANVLSLEFDDGSSVQLPPIPAGQGYHPQQFALSSIAGAEGKKITYLRINNTNTSREVSLRNIQIYDPSPAQPEPEPPPELAVQEPAVEEPSLEKTAAQNPNPGYKPRQAVSTARDALVEMDGIEVTRPSNTIDDLVPGITLSVRNPSAAPVNLSVESDRESVKDQVISLVGNYNRLMAELNVLTRRDEAIVNELTYLTPEEQTELKKKLGAFSGDSSLSQLRASLQGIFTAPYQLADGRTILASEVGIGSNVQRRGGVDQSKLRGYMEIDEKVLDAAIDTRLADMRYLFGRDTDGDLVVDSGLAYSLDRVSRPYVEVGGVIALKTSSVDSRIKSDKSRIETLDRRLAAKEQELKTQYNAMESAYSELERMSTTLDNFSSSQSGNR